jgi:hypothetical protein
MVVAGNVLASTLLHSSEQEYSMLDIGKRDKAEDLNC